MKGNLDREKIERALHKCTKLLKFPKDIEIYFLENMEYCNDIISTLHKHIRDSFKQICLVEKSSFSFNHKDRNIIVISLDEKKQLVRNQKALMGLILHEVMHAMQVKRGYYKTIYDAYNEVFNKNKKLLNKLSYPNKITKSLFSSVGYITVLLMKDLFCNSELISRNCGSYLLEYYVNELRGTKKCPRPVFYNKFKEAAKKDPGIIEIAFEFEFSLLSIVLPFQKYKTDKSLLLMKYINNCYELNIHEIARKCHELINLYLNYYQPDKEFSKRFFNAVFNKVYMLLV